MTAILVDNSVLVHNAPPKPRQAVPAGTKGVYTTTIASRHLGIADWPLHVTRLLTNLKQAEWGQNIHQVLTRFNGLQGIKLKDNLAAHVRSACSICWSNPGNTDDNLTIFLQLYIDQQGHPHVSCHASTYALAIPLPAVTAAIVGPPRSNPMIKDCAWVHDRAVCEQRLPAGFGEGLLMGNSGRLTEGLVTNLWVVGVNEQQGKAVLHTAPDQTVLGGIMRHKIIKACGAMGIELDQVHPHWFLRSTWTEAFISNSLRILQPLSAISLHDNSWVQATTSLPLDTVYFQSAPGPVASALLGYIINTTTYTPLEEL